MHLIFERSNGRFKSNCNILALAWMPYYHEPTFRRAHLDYHHKLLAHLTGPTGANRIAEPAGPHGSTREPWRHIGREHSRQPSSGADRSSASHQRSALNLEQSDSGASRHLEQAMKRRRLSNSRLCEQYQRYVYLKYGRPTQSIPCNRAARRDSAESAEVSDAAINHFVDEHYGRLNNFGWLAIGNIGRIVGVTLTSVVQPPSEIDGRRPSAQQTNEPAANDLIVLHDANQSGDNPEPSAGPSAEIPRPDKKCSRDNHNLRGHLDEIILVKWNELYQKLASVDSKGNVLIWSKVNDKFTIQTPFYNKSKSVADFKWSNDGKTALICYTDSFILVGGSSGQRHWHSMLNLDDYHITCASWTPDDEQLLLGVSNGNVVVIDLPTSELTELIVGRANIRALCWSSEGVNLRHLGDRSSPSVGVQAAPVAGPGQQDCDRGPLEDLVQPAQHDQDSSMSAGEEGDLQPSPRRLNSSVVNRRRLSRNCALFCRYRPHGSSAQSSPMRSPHPTPRRPPNAASPSSGHHRDILSVDFADNTIKLFDGGLGDPKPREIEVSLESYLMAWSADGKTLAVGGFNIYTSAPSVGYLRCKYLNSLKFYNQKGALVHERKMNFTRYPITALAWAHDDTRLFVATGPRLHCARVYQGIPRLSLLSLACLHRHTKLMDKSDVLKSLISRRLVASVLNWQSFNCPLDVTRHLGSASSPSKVANSADHSRPPDRLKALEHVLAPALGADPPASNGGAPDGSEHTNLMNNINIANYQLPAKLKSKIDQLFLQTVRQPYDEQLSLNDIAWHVPKNRKRHYCTLICYTHELADIGCVGHQYKAHELLANQQIGLAGSESRDSDQFKIFILYVEFQGSLIPILKARRVGFLKPEFVLFDPEDHASSYHQRTQKVSDVSNPSGDAGLSQSRRKQPPPLGDNCAELHGVGCSDFAGSSSKRADERQSGEKRNHHRSLFGNDSLLAAHSRSLVGSNSTSDERSVRSMLNQDQHLFYLLKISLQQSSRDRNPTQSISALQHDVLRALERHRLSGAAQQGAPSRGSQLASAAYSSQLGAKSLPENGELIRIKSNIWGTKFKLVNMCNRKIGARAVLGSMKYKASLLHLQPRQIFLNLKDMSNYCTLCSMHHHTRLPARQCQAKRAPQPGGGRHVLDLLDLPIGPPPSCLATPVRSAPSRQSRTRHRSGQQTTPGGARKSGEKVVLAVGDNIRIAPKLESNQRYKYANPADSSASRSSSLSGKSGHASTSSQSLTHCDQLRRLRFSQRSKNAAGRSELSRTSAADCSPAADSSVGQDNDILTLSLDQSDQVQLYMSSSTPSHRSNSLESRPADMCKQASEAHMDEFLQANKTLKSIQTITRMIVDLSSRAHDDGAPGREPQQSADDPSPMKLLKTDLGAAPRSPAREYIPPDTPVHRPRRSASQKRSDGLPRAHSAASTPRLTPLSARPLTSHRNDLVGLHPDDPLPTPPPSVPFRRKLSTSAKRFFDGSLRSLAGISGVGGGALAGYLTSDDPDSEDCQSLVQRRRSRPRSKTRHHYKSQPCTPFRGLSEKREGSLLTSRDPDGRQTILDLASLRSQVVQKLRQSANWMSSSSKNLDETLGTPVRSRMDRHAKLPSRKQQSRSASCTTRSKWTLTSAHPNHNKLTPRALDRSSSSSSSSSSSDLISLITSDSCSSLDSDKNNANREFGFLDHTIRSKLFKHSSRYNSSDASAETRAKEQNLSLKKERRPRASGARADVDKPRSRPTRRHRRTQRSLCQNASCCCARELKLSNRPPVWNEYSQVYQLDFGGRVTQESAKNLQIDFNGDLVST